MAKTDHQPDYHALSELVRNAQDFEATCAAERSELSVRLKALDEAAASVGGELGAILQELVGYMRQMVEQRDKHNQDILQIVALVNRIDLAQARPGGRG